MNGGNAWRYQRVTRQESLVTDTTCWVNIYNVKNHEKCNIFTSWLLVTVVHLSTRRGSLLCVVLSGCNTDSLLVGHSGCRAWRVAHSLHVKYLLCRLRVSTLQVLQDISCRNLQSVHACPVVVKVVSPVDRIILYFSTSGTGIAIPSGEHEFTPGFSGVCVARSLVFCVVFCRSLFVLFPSAIMFSVLIWFSDSANSFDNFWTCGHCRGGSRISS